MFDIIKLNYSLKIVEWKFLVVVVSVYWFSKNFNPFLKHIGILSYQKNCFWILRITYFRCRFLFLFVLFLAFFWVFKFYFSARCISKNRNSNSPKNEKKQSIKKFRTVSKYWRFSILLNNKQKILIATLNFEIMKTKNFMKIAIMFLLLGKAALSNAQVTIGSSETPAAGTLLQLKDVVGVASSV